MDKAPTGTRYGVPAYRERVTAQLSDAYGRNMLDQREFERRVELAQQAETLEQLQAIVADFGASAAASPQVPELAGRRVTTVMSSQTHQLLPDQTTFSALTVMGNLDLDLRAFRGSGATLVVNLSGCMSETKVRVPRGTIVQRQSRLVMGEYRATAAGLPGVLVKAWNRLVGSVHRAPASPFPPDGPPPTVILRGTLVMGSLYVREDSD